MSALARRKLATGHWQILDSRGLAIAEAMLDPRHPDDREPWHWYMTNDDSAPEQVQGRSPLLTNAIAAVYHVTTS